MSVKPTRRSNAIVVVPNAQSREVSRHLFHPKRLTHLAHLRSAHFWG
jgi:hypothetical protein